MISKENISEGEELVLLGPKLVKSKRDIIYSIPSSFVGNKPVEVNRAEVIREFATSEVQTEAMEEEETAFIESDLEQYELCREVIPVKEYIDENYASILYDEVMGTMREHRREFLAAGFVKMVSDADHLFGQITIQHGLFRAAADNIREKNTAKIAGTINCLEMTTNYVRDAMIGAQKEWNDTLQFIRQKEEEAQLETIINEERERLREEERNARASLEATVDESSIIQCQSVVDMTNLSMSGEVLEPQTPSVEIIQPAKSFISETSIEVIEPKQFIATGKRTDTSRIIGTYEIDNAELGVTKLDKSQVLYSMYTIQQYKERWNERIEHMEHRLRNDIMPHVNFPIQRKLAYPVTLF
jgi:hypothetical protein